MKNKNLCVLPFIHLATHPIGTVTPCCETDMREGKSTIKINGTNAFLNKNSFNDIFNSKLMCQLRKEMLSDKRPAICHNCYFKEDNNIQSKRIESFRYFPYSLDKFEKMCDENGFVRNIDLEYIELRLGTTCNLKCLTCNPFSSSKWNEDIQAFEGTKFASEYFKLDEKSDWYKDEAFYEELFKYCKKLKKININGGEPTIISAHFYFLELLIKNNLASEIELDYYINLTYLPDHLLQLWSAFKKVKIRLSIDDYGLRNNYLRFGSQWEIIENNLNKLVNCQLNPDLRITQTVSAFNVYNLNSLKKYSMLYGIGIDYNFVKYPAFQHVSVLPEDFKQESFSRATLLNASEKEMLESELFKMNINKNAKSNDPLWNKLVEFVKILDQRRQVNIIDYYPEWKSLLFISSLN